MTGAGSTSQAARGASGWDSCPSGEDEDRAAPLGIGRRDALRVFARRDHKRLRLSSQMLGSSPRSRDSCRAFRPQVGPVLLLIVHGQPRRPAHVQRRQPRARHVRTAEGLREVCAQNRRRKSGCSWLLDGMVQPLPRHQTGCSEGHRRVRVPARARQPQPQGRDRRDAAERDVR